MRRNIAYSLLLTSLAAGCSTTPQRNFTGQPYPTSFATVITATSAKSSKVTFSEVNGRRASDGWRDAPSVVDVRPGHNTFKIVARSADNKGSYSASVSFNVLDGRMYRVTLDSMPEDLCRKPLTLESSLLREPLSPKVDIDGQSFSDIASVLDHWGILSKTSDVSVALSSESRRLELTQAVDQRVQSFSYAQAKSILSATTELLEAVSREIQERKKTLPTGFLVRDTTGDSLVASIGAPYKEDPPPPPYTPVYIPPYTYTPPPKIYTPPKPTPPMNWSPPPAPRR